MFTTSQNTMLSTVSTTLQRSHFTLELSISNALGDKVMAHSADIYHLITFVISSREGREQLY